MRARRLNHRASVPVILALVCICAAIAPSAAQAAFGFSPGSLGLVLEEGQGVKAVSLPAGSHPSALTTTFSMNTTAPPPWYSGALSEVPDEELDNLSVEEPPGFVGDPTATPRCSMAAFLEIKHSKNACPNSAAVGYVRARLGFNELVWDVAPVYNLEPAHGEPARLGFTAIAVPVTLGVGLQEHREPNIVASSVGTSQVIQIYGAVVTLWGDPAASAHDPFRGDCLKIGGYEEGGAPVTTLPEPISEGSCPSGTPEKPFLTLPSSCPSSLVANFSAESRQHPSPADRVFGSAESVDDATPPRPLSTSGCEGVNFSPVISVRNTSQEADSPSGLKVGIEFDQSGLTSPSGRAQSEIKKAVVTLPEGVAVNPSQASGLISCSEAQLEAESPASAPGAGCPQASKLGTVEARTPLLEEPLEGSVFLARQRENRFGTLLALYVTLRNPQLGIIVRLAGKVEPDPATGRLVATFEGLPQLPFSNFAMNLNDGPRAALVTPPTCGEYTTRAELTPWSNPASTLVANSSFKVTSGPHGGSCQAPPFDPTLTAGSISPLAGAYTPFTLHLERQDGAQRIAGLTTTLPKGLLARLAGIPYCPDSVLASVPSAEGTGAGWLADPRCPASSQVGTVSVGAGAGPIPLQVETGRAYLAGPYKGAPLSLAIVTPALAGPFDLGNVVVRTALQVDSETAQVTAVSDSIPTIVHGIPLDLRSLEVRLDRPDFTRNPTSCDRQSFTGSAVSASGATAPLSDPFQVGSCERLGFQPRLKLSLRGSTKRAGHPGLKAVLTYPKQGAFANIRRAQVNLPHSVFLDQSNLNKTCTRPVLSAGKCPKSTIYGKAKAWTPLLAEPLVGSVYLVGGYGYELPALVAELNGQIRVVLKGKVDSGPNHGIRNTFEAVPDAPVSRFVLELKGGKKYSLLENSEPLCAKPQHAITRFTAQNGAVADRKPLIADGCGARKAKR